MLICGLKLTHDGAVALIEDGTLVFSVEMEKLNNNPRFSGIADLDVVGSVLGSFGYDIDSVDHFAVDGWGGTTCSPINLKSGDQQTSVIVAPYRERGTQNVFHSAYQGVLPIAGRERSYSSYFHVSGHVASAYYSSPFAARSEPSYVLVWDGGMFPRLYFVDATPNIVKNCGALFPVMGHVYATAGNYFGPWPRSTNTSTVAGQSVAGQLMAYISLGSVREEVVDTLARVWKESFTGPSERAVLYRKKVGGWGLRSDAVYLGEYYRDLRKELGGRYSDEDVLASMHAFIGATLLDALRRKIGTGTGDGLANLCFSGGCALNIKWNSQIRDSGLFRDVWVPPFPNDSGAAIGTALCDAVSSVGGPYPALGWHARLGPDVVGETPASVKGWAWEMCDAAQLAHVLHEEQEPVVVLNGRAELGPRALGARSILAAPVQTDMKDRLNEVKSRAHFRPVAPICLESRAAAIFSPGTPDPYMLFDHQVRPEYLNRIPAVVHLDGTARLQTVNQSDDPFLASLLAEYDKLSGLPVLCNTSANYNGCGFFPDVRSAAEWGGVERIWNAGFLYRRQNSS